jgi:hypothetical protein
MGVIVLLTLPHGLKLREAMSGRLFSNLGSGVLEQWSAEKFGRPFRAIHEGGLPRPEGLGYYLLPLRGKLP